MGYITHIGKVKSHTGVTYNDEADNAARGVVDGHKTPDITFTDADPPIRGLRTWPKLRVTRTENTPTTHNLADLHASLHKLIRKHTPNTTTSHSTTYGKILQDARTKGADHTIHAYSTAPYRARRDSLVVAWGVRIHRCKRKHSPSLVCTKCQAPLTNTHILGGCRFTAKLRIKRHNSTFRLLLQHLQKSNGGRWPILCADLGHKPITDFTSLNLDTDTPQYYHHQDIKHSTQEGLQDDKSDNPDYPQTIPDYILHPQHRPKHHKPDLIRAVGFTLKKQGRLVKDLTYRGRRQIQIIECKYSTDGNIQTIIDHIYDIYEPLRHALQTHGTLKADVKIIPIVISRTGTFHVKTQAEISQLVSFTEEPPDELTFKQLPPTAKRITMALHIHAQEWLSHISKISRKILTTKTKTALATNT